jgi:outer membrane lipoprotein-sorting protein
MVSDLVLSRLPLLSLIFLTTASVAAPAKKVSIDPAARAVLQRAAALYSKTPKWSGQITEASPVGSVTYNKISFMRPNRLRYDMRSGPDVSFDIFDGKTHYLYMKDKGKKAFTRKTPQRTSLARILLMRGAPESFLSSFLHGQTGLESPLQNDPDITSFAVTMRPAAKWKGQSCRRVYLATHFKVDENTIVDSVADELWFNPTGLLVRSVSWSYISGGAPEMSSCELTAQEFEPKFGAKTFEMVPTKGK